MEVTASLSQPVRRLLTVRFHVWMIGALAAVILFTNLSSGLSGYDDATYAHEGRQMLATGDWWNVRYDGRVSFEYPPLFIWLEALSMAALGITDFAAKVPAAVLGLATILLLFFTVRRLSEDFWLPVDAAWILLLSQYFLKYSRHAMTDVPFVFFVTLSLYLYVRGLKQPWFLAGSGLAIGLAVLTRSILGAIPAGIVLAHLIVTRRYWVFRSPQFAAAVAAAALLPGLWFAAQYSLYGSYFLAGHFYFIGRKVGSSRDFTIGHFALGLLKYPWWLFKLYWPWLPFMLAGLVSQTKAMLRTRNDLASLMVLWVVLVLVPFSLVDAKALRYILPAFPAFAALSAVSLNNVIGKLRQSRPAAVYSVLCGFALAIAALANPRYRAEDMKELAHAIDAHTAPDERVLVYSFGDTGYGYHNQLLWYANRLTDHLIYPVELKQSLRTEVRRVFVVDRANFAGIVQPTGVRLEMLGETPSFVCFKTLE
jgi:4-amino-4-deoxy-L-arabinose transferase-like glycosyltransferase